MTCAAVTTVPPSMRNPVPWGIGSFRSETSTTFFGACASTPISFKAAFASSSRWNAVVVEDGDDRRRDGVEDHLGRRTRHRR